MLKFMRQTLSKFFKSNRTVIFNLLTIYLLAVAVRLYVVRDYNFPFWFDVGRDAAVSREILEKPDLKIQGPSASGTNDTVYHGVFYYYLIGPLYTLFGGNPQLVLMALIFLSSLSIIPVFLLAAEIGESRITGYFAALLYVFSYDAIRGNVWLSNPVIDSVMIPFFFYLLWRIFFKNHGLKNEVSEIKLFPWLALVLALIHQGAILYVTLWGVIGVAFLYAYEEKKFRQNLTSKLILQSGLVYLLGISTMILAQFKAWRAGIFNLVSLKDYASWPDTGLGVVWDTLSLYLKKIAQVSLPTYPILGLIFVGAALFFVSKLPSQKKSFLFLALMSPLFLLGWHFGNMYHGVLGLEVIILIMTALFLTNLPKKPLARGLQVGFIFLFLLSNLNMAKAEFGQKRSLYFLPQGAYLKDQLNLLDETYKIADGQEFTISSVTNPFGYNTLWAYLYDWYGQKTYGYKPKYFGPDQTGIFGGELLEPAQKPAQIHFSIYDPSDGIPGWLFEEFSQKQNIDVGSASAILQFGTLKVEVR